MPQRYGTGLIDYLNYQHLSEQTQIEIILDYYKKAKLEELVEFIGDKVCKITSEENSENLEFMWLEGIDADRIKYIRQNIGGEIPDEYSFIPNFETLVPRDWFDTYIINLKDDENTELQLSCGSIYCAKDKLYKLQCDINSGDYEIPEGINDEDFMEFLSEYKRQIELAGQFCFLLYMLD